MQHPPQFHLAIEPLANAEYALAILQRPYPAIAGERAKRGTKLVRADGLHLISTWDMVLDVLRANHYKPAAIHRDQKRRLAVDEASGVRLALLFKAIEPLSDLDHIRSVQQGIWAMSDEESYYWFSKCYGPNGRRAQRALRVLLGGVD